jgi:hypothetical protein
MALKFNFRPLTVSADELNVQTGKLGTGTDVYTDADIGKPVKMGTQGNFVICTTGDAIDGFIDSIDGGPKADGLIVGGVARGQLGTRFRAIVFASQTTPLTDDAISVLDYVTAGVNTAAGTAKVGKHGVVKVSATPTRFRIVSLAGDIAATVADTTSGLYPPSIEAVIERC